MKARTRIEREVLKMAEELPPVTEAQKRWGFNLFKKNGIYWKKGLVWCQCCGHVDKVDKSELAVSLEHGATKEEEERRKLIAKYEKQYYDHRKNFFGVSFSDGTIVVKVLNSVREIADEGKAMRHCVFTNEYYDHRKHPSSLILSARDNDDNRIETVEVNINTWKIVQSRGVCNSRTAKHEQICRLVEQNMFKLKQKAI